MESIGRRCQFLAVLALSFLCAHDIPNYCSESQLPKTLTAVLKSQFAAWQIKTLEQLQPYNQKLWKENRDPNTCPGIAKGRFEGPGKETVALLLIPRYDAKGYKVLVVSRRDTDDKWFWTVIDESTAPSPPMNAVVYQVPPGSYTSVDGKRTVKLDDDGIVIEDMGVSSRLFFWHNNGFDRIFLTD